MNDTFGRYGHQRNCGYCSLPLQAGRYIDRWGGDEFLMVTESESIADIIAHAENLRKQIAQYAFPTEGGLTCSFGCALHDNHN